MLQVQKNVGEFSNFLKNFDYFWLILKNSRKFVNAVFYSNSVVSKNFIIQEWKIKFLNYWDFEHKGIYYEETKKSQEIFLIRWLYGIFLVLNIA